MASSLPIHPAANGFSAAADRIVTAAGRAARATVGTI